VLLSHDVFIGVEDELLEDNGGTFMDGALQCHDPVVVGRRFSSLRCYRLQASWIKWIASES
jgi:hypothetical protein